jgi:electron transfer flavoprotein beta subunit
MRIVVLVKHVPEPTASWRFAADLTLDRAGIENRLSELDEYAVEQAIRLVETGATAEITFVTMGPARAVDGLRKALAMGGDRGVHILDDGLHGSDAVATSLVLGPRSRSSASISSSAGWPRRTPRCPSCRSWSPTGSAYPS